MRPKIRQLSAVRFGSLAEGIHRIRDPVKVGVVEIGIGVCRHRDRCVPHRRLKELHIGAGGSREGSVGVPQIAVMPTSA
jgi:hypothetical protein